MSQQSRQTPELQEILIREERETLRERGWVGVAYMASPLVLAFSLVDWLYIPEQWLHFLGLRALVIPVSLIYVICHRLGRIAIEWPSHFFTLFLGTYNAYMIAQTGYESSAYINGLNLVAIGSMGFLPWSSGHLALSVSTIYLPTVLLFLSKGSTFHQGDLITSLAFCGSTIFLCGITWYLFRRMRTRELRARLNLKDLVRTQEQIIQEKTKESVYLHKLSRQFSDKTIDLVKAGAINLDARERREVAAIFIDIEGSTKKANTLEHRQFLTILDTFFNICTEVFIRNDITVGTFLGDGLLAFANAPLDTPNAKQRALSACIEIVNKRDRLDQIFSKVWLSDFNIRIGLSYGQAYCGFFPSGTKGNYSINGPIVNLSSRLCDMAPANTVCLPTSYVEGLDLNELQVEITPVKNRRKLKGFEDQKIEIVSVRPLRTSKMTTKQAEITPQVCPLCQSNTSVDRENENFSIISCLKCHYTDIVESKHDEQIAS